MWEGPAFLSKKLIKDVGLSCFDIGSDLYNGYLYIDSGDALWGSFTLIFVLLPGFLELLYWTACLCTKRADTGEFCYWSWMFGPFTFPISTPVWHFTCAIKGVNYYKEKYSKSMVFKSLEAFSESAPQLLLQTTILIIRWTRAPDHIWQILSALSSSIHLSVTSAEHHMHELSAKETIPKFSRILLIFPFFFVNIFLRTLLIAAVIAYLGWWSVVFIAAFIVSNFVYATFIFKTDFPKDIWTSISSVLTLACFVSRFDVESIRNERRNNPAHLFYYYFIASTVSTCVILSFVMGGLVALLQKGFLTYSCDQLPIFSCADKFILRTTKDGVCPYRRNCDSDEGPHDLFSYFVVPIWGILALLHVVIVCAMRFLCPSMVAQLPIQRRL